MIDESLYDYRAVANVFCKNPVFVYQGPSEELYLVENYVVGEKYIAKYCLDSVPYSHPGNIDETIRILFEWKVYYTPTAGCNYQFTQEEFEEYFVEISKVRDDKISEILNYEY